LLVDWFFIWFLSGLVWFLVSTRRVREEFARSTGKMGGHAGPRWQAVLDAEDDGMIWWTSEDVV